VHELALAQDVLDIAIEAGGGARVRRIVREIGTLSAVLPDAMRFCFDLVARDTAAAGARLDIIETPGRGRCRRCGAEVVMERPIAACACGAIELDWLAGQELRLREVEVA
jgi:hydrogenase nickel incorporation protein HypA/HybF